MKRSSSTRQGAFLSLPPPIGFVGDLLSVPREISSPTPGVCTGGKGALNARSSAAHTAITPPNFPIGVRAALTI
jgi:hypothetical protein